MKPFPEKTQDLRALGRSEFHTLGSWLILGFSHSLFIYLLFFCMIFGKALGKFQTVSLVLRADSKGNSLRALGQSCQAKAVPCQGSSFLIAGGNWGRHLKGKVADGGRAEIWSGAQLGDSHFCFWESGVSWGLIQQHASSLWLTLS